MSEITLYNTLTRRKEPLAPLDPRNVRMYVCGPTVYDRAHIGNARAVVVFDVLYRLLRQTYGADHVTYVRNFTDVDDKINARAAATLLPGETELAAIRRITDETIGWYHADMDALGALRPNREPRATEYIAQMVAMIETLIAEGHAYEVEGHVLFSVPSDPDYGKLSRRSVDDMRAGARVEVAPYKRDPMDFVLWKPSDATTPGWDSPWGRGRPGWHIECSAMARDLLGESFDIHGGGIDLAFPHHENELAQSRCAHPHADYAKIWMHNGMLNIEGDKMSKSLGNFFTVKDVLHRMNGNLIRYVLLSAHYRSPIDWTEERVENAKIILTKWRNTAARARRAGIELDPGIPPDEQLIDFLGDDLNTHGALQRLSELADAAPLNENAMRVFLASSHFMGFNPDAGISPDFGTEMESAIAERILDAMAAELHACRQRGDFAAADELRAKMQALGVTVQSNKAGTSWERTVDFDSARILSYATAGERAE